MTYHGIYGATFELLECPLSSYVDHPAFPSIYQGVSSDQSAVQASKESDKQLSPHKYMQRTYEENLNFHHRIQSIPALLQFVTFSLQEM